MRDLEEIRKEAEDECSANNCQSWPVICIIAMAKAIKEHTDDVIEQIEQLR